MNNIQAKDLIQAKALGCLDPDEDAMMNRLMSEDNDFPWLELGQYQNLVAFLPVLLDIEIPDQDIKDNVAQKLYELGNLKAVAEPEPEPLPEPEPEPEPPIEEIELPEQPIEDKIINPDPDIKIDDELPEVIKSAARKDIAFKDYGMPQIPKLEDVPQTERIVREKKEDELKPDRINRGPVQKLSRKEFENRNIKSHVSKPPVEEKIVEVKKTDKTALVTAIILFVVTLIVLIFMYFKFSGDIQQNKEEIDTLKKMIGSEEVFQKTFQHPNLI